MSPSSCIAGVLWLGLVMGCAQAESKKQAKSTTSDQTSGGVVTPAKTARDTIANTVKPVASGPDSLDRDWQPQAESREWKSIVLHHSATEVGSVESIHAEHLQRRDATGNPWRGIGYHFVIGNGHGMPDGEVQATFRWTEQSAGAHSGDPDYNETGIGICLIGNFEESPPTPDQIKSVKRLVGNLKRAYGLAAEHVLRHAEIKPTACPGRLFPLPEVAATVVGHSPADSEKYRRIAAAESSQSVSKMQQSAPLNVIAE